MANVRLGFAVRSGEEVTIPVRHMVVTGITQEAGKTTTLEALIERADCQALAFITKRGEKTFTQAHRIDPYFREQVDWEFVASILESSRGEKMKFERAWIMKASRGATTLAGVLTNVRKLGAAAAVKNRGMDADLYMQLEEYLSVIVPAIAAVRWAKTITLRHGLNVMDLVGLSDTLQQLVIRSAMLWLHENAEQTILVIPEAWKFVPQKYRSPVKQAAESYIRQGAGIGNYVWLDSQDIAGVDKPILKMCPVWILGVQRERNEIKTTLDHIPAGTRKPKPEEIAHLGLGQFIACFGKHTIPTYVQPSWMDELTAVAVAMGEVSIDDVAPAPKRAAPTPKPEDPTVKASEARQLERDNERLSKENEELRDRLERLENPVIRAAAAGRASAKRGPVDVMQGGEFEVSHGDGVLSDQLWQQIRARLFKDPKVLQVALTKPGLEIEVTREVIKADGTSLRGRVAQLMANGFLDDGMSGTAVQNELARRGKDPGPGNVYKELDQLAEWGFLTIEQGADDRGRKRKEYKLVPDMRPNIIEHRAR